MKKKLKTQYPYAAKKEEYIEEIKEFYQKKYPQFSAIQIATPISIVAGLISSEIIEFDSYRIMLLRINTIKNLGIKFQLEDTVLNCSMREIVGFLKGLESSAQYHLKKIREIELPQDMSKYMEYFSEMTRQVINDICSATEAKIPYAAKIEYQRWMNSDKENIGATDTEQLTFAQRIEQKRKPLADAADRDNEESMPNAKKPRVTFADEVIKKKTADSSGEVEERVDDSSASTEDDCNTVSSIADKSVETTSRSIGIEDDKKEDDGGTAEKCSTQDGESTDEQKSALLNPQLNQLYTWLSQLPEWMQEQMLNSAPVQALIEAAKQDAKIYDSNYTANQLANLFAGLEFHDSTNVVSGNRDDKVSIANSTSEELVDTSLILDELQVTGLILPTEAVGSGTILPEPALHGFEVF